MPTISKEEEARVVKAIQALQNQKYPTVAAASRGERCDYGILCARIQGKKGNHSEGGRNKRLNVTQEASLKLYCERCIFAGQPPERKHIEKAANLILHVDGEKKVSKPWLSCWLG